ncbi:MAG: hypothetical protein RIE86_11860 [Imperialibacter sp.]|uniref:CopG family transcriptional regulator n=1 Tax=Imperialibacter roseus TaxID=1324217 RepID=A0ABZ0IU46_9BACT|nr:hypothetical protein [Imperialibacter roseus]WOK07221.1 hypothetical protein RT717_01120 [Imperialibacter roseus]
MDITKQDFKAFLREFEEKDERKRTVNITESLHSFFKSVAANYDLPISTVIHNVLIQWKQEHQGDIKEDLLKRISKNEF